MADGAKALRQPTRQAFCAFPSAGKGEGISQPRGKAEAGRNRRTRRPPDRLPPRLRPQAAALRRRCPPERSEHKEKGGNSLAPGRLRPALRLSLRNVQHRPDS